MRELVIAGEGQMIFSWEQVVDICQLNLELRVVILFAETSLEERQWTTAALRRTLPLA
jgi:hypothetical protein